MHLNNDGVATNDVTWDHDGEGATEPVNVTKDCFDRRPVIDLDDDGLVEEPGMGYTLTWEAYNYRGRAVNEFTLTIPG